MTLSTYIKSRGLTTRNVAQKMGVSRKMLYPYGRNVMPRVDTMKKIAAAMTELGAPTRMIDVFAALSSEAVPVENIEIAEG